VLRAEVVAPVADLALARVIAGAGVVPAMTKVGEIGG